MKTEFIQAITPLILGTLGTAIAILPMLITNMNDATRSGAYNLAGQMLAGAFALAQHKTSENANVQGNRISIETQKIPDD